MSLQLDIFQNQDQGLLKEKSKSQDQGQGGLQDQVSDRDLLERDHLLQDRNTTIPKVLMQLKTSVQGIIHFLELRSIEKLKECQDFRL